MTFFVDQNDTCKNDFSQIAVSLLDSKIFLFQPKEELNRVVTTELASRGQILRVSSFSGC